MPSPLSSTPVAAAADPSKPAASPLSNGVNGQGAVPSADGPAVDAPVPDGDSLMREGKQKAKAVLAASGVDFGPVSASEPPAAPVSQPDTTTPAPGEAANGMSSRSPSRKRSRSGSRKPTPADEPPSGRNVLLQRYINRDQYATIALLDRDQVAAEITDEVNEKCKLYRDWYGARRHQDPGSVFGYGYLGYGNGITEMKGSRLQYPSQARRPGSRKSRPFPRIPRERYLAQAEQVEELIPLRLDIELDKIKLRDTLTWNLHDRITDTTIFAENLVEDFRLPPEVRGTVIQHVEREINEQIRDFYPHVCIEDEPLDPHLPYFAYKNDEMRILIKLNITIGQHTLVDQFEWEINNPLNSPEEFARQMAAENALSGEFTTAIAHSIREQCQMFTKSLYITGHSFDGRPVEDADIRDNFLPSPLPSVFRPMQSAKDYQPFLWELSEADLERAELSIMREQRRQKRSVNRRGGPALPDLKDRQRTVRTLIVSSVIPGAAETIEESHIFKITRSKKSSGRSGRIGDDDTDDSDSDESVPESPAPSQLPSGTARTRGIRGAATVAQAAMRSALGRSATPEVSGLQHDARASSRSLRYEAREESVPEPTSLIVKLRINPKRWREYLQNPKTFAKPATTPSVAPTPSVARSTPGANSMPPPPSPAMAPRANPTPSPKVEASPKSTTKAPTTPTPKPEAQKKWEYYPDGRADAPFPLPPTTPAAPPPPWLQAACEDLRRRYPDDRFEATMRYNVINTVKNETIKPDVYHTYTTLPADTKALYLPRLRCHDCPGKLYNPGPDLTVENFEVHLKNRQHLAAVQARKARGG